MRAARLFDMTPAMRRILLVSALALFGCTKTPNPMAELHVSCEGKQLDTKTEPPEQGQACAPGSQATLSYDNDGNWQYVSVFAITRDNILFWFPGGEDGESVAAQPGHNVALPGSFTIPPKTRDVMAIFSHEPLKARDLAQRTRDVTLGLLPNVGELRVRVSREHGPVD